MDLRSATNDDVPAISDLFVRSSATNDGDRALIALHPEWMVWSAANLAWVRVACIDGAIVGFATAVPSGEFLELEDLFVDPDHMRRGIASALIEDIAAGGVRIEVTANPHAMAFYESAGFVVTGEAQTEGGPAPRMCRTM
ncbi:MAG TPA: GNAT family N-acetyltransferase [Acidimicrobiales bacterium]|nr:GNAT family N-acetyltransferase [Acidimicrobiales bacterium]